ncbi:MAG TPA: alcohol dehydrogenase catalytic domain-containing protein [Candidatus Binatia bacterium]|nr:alcohol dehydrogenase catalytic domain-containing protein [Candidatus Binatia bacterium]
MKALVYDVNAEDIIHLIQEASSSKEAFLGEHSPLRLRDVPDLAAPPFDDWVLIRTRLCGICGSDTKQVFIDFEGIDSPLATLASFPQVMGHEVVGTVDRVGPAVTQVRPGQRVVLNPWLSCAPRGIAPVCEMCADGQFSLCVNFKRGRLAPGIHTGTCRDASGGYAPVLPAHESMAIPVPDGVTDEEAVLADPFSVSLHSVLWHPPAPGDIVVVYGCGTLGMCAIEILNKLFPGVRIYAIARFDHQAELARRLGAIEVVPWRPVEGIIERFAEITGAREVLPPIEGTGGLPMLHGARGVRVVYNTVGTPESVGVAIRIAGPRSTVVMSGVDTPARFEWSPHYFKEVNLVGSNAFGVEEWNGKRQHAMRHYFDLVRDERIDLTPILTHRFRLDDYRDAFRAAHEQGESGAVKVLFAFA